METTKLLDSTTSYSSATKQKGSNPGLSSGLNPNTNSKQSTECINNHLFELLKKAHLLNTIEKDNIRRVTACGPGTSLGTGSSPSPNSVTPPVNADGQKSSKQSGSVASSAKRKTSTHDRVLIDILGERSDDTVEVEDVSFDLDSYQMYNNGVSGKERDSSIKIGTQVPSSTTKTVSSSLEQNLIDTRGSKQHVVSVSELASCLRTIVNDKVYADQNSLLFSLNFNVTENFLVVSTNDITENLRHIDPHLDRVLHQTKFSVFEMPECIPICYLEKTIKESDLTYLKPHNSYLKSYVYDVVKDYHTKEFNKSVVSVYKHHIGSYIVMFHCRDRWYFVLHNNVHEFNSNTHPILYEHLGKHVSKFDRNLCYHMVLVDSRIRRLITPSSETNHVVLIRLTEKYTLREFIPPATVQFTPQSATASSFTSFASVASGYNSLGNNGHETVQTADLVHGVFVRDKRVYVSCLDELQVRLEELDITNAKSKRLVNRGYIAKIRVSDLESVNIAYDTQTYKRLMSVVPVGMSIHEVHLRLYQQDKLNYFLQYVTDSSADVVKRINTSMSTMSREILDIYHMTRKKKNSELYNILPQSYRQILYQLHSDYIAQKNKKDLPDTATWRLKTDGKLEDDATIIFEDCKFDKFELDGSSSDSNDDKGSGDNDGKVSISVDNVYTKLKDLDMYTLVELYKDRDELIKNIETSHLTDDIDVQTTSNSGSSHGVGAMTNPIKSCTNTKIQSKLLSMKTPI
ncbi:hypothetical protein YASMINEVIRUS_763 [Yasminevirus sp. GU-2018]|uniref:Uncharacterized protein n=1 Tax=Yasminevirus sp. GU-2018 TaxID=2420051 RepID=A0A5K0U909_9VIRU|nr:hypothetical protein YASMINEVIRUS_763 [Yasminevirus sp. GU-2018]